MGDSTCITDAAAMERLGASLVDKAHPLPYLIYLNGDLGAGKTTLVRGLLRQLGYQGPVKSPTFTYVEPYEQLTPMVYHFDFYRLAPDTCLEALGVWEMFQASAICLIEWPSVVADQLPTPNLTIDLVIEDDKRYMTMST